MCSSDTGIPNVIFMRVTFSDVVVAGTANTHATNVARAKIWIRMSK